MQAYVSIGKWGWQHLSAVGKIGACRTCCEGDHIGIVFRCVPPELIKVHSAPALSEESGRGRSTVGWDSMMDGKPRFQSLDTFKYWDSTVRSELFPIVDVDPVKLHAACVYISKMKPHNNRCYRLNPLFGGCYDCVPGENPSDPIGPSTCVALVMRAIVAAQSGSTEGYRSDAYVVEQLGLPTGACQPKRLVAYHPGQAVRALRKVGAVSASVGWVEDLAPCVGSGDASAGNAMAQMPLLGLTICRT